MRYVNFEAETKMIGKLSKCALLSRLHFFNFHTVVYDYKFSVRDWNALLLFGFDFDYIVEA